MVFCDSLPAHNQNHELHTLLTFDAIAKIVYLEPFLKYKLAAVRDSIFTAIFDDGLKLAMSASTECRHLFFVYFQIMVQISN